MFNQFNPVVRAKFNVADKLVEISDGAPDGYDFGEAQEVMLNPSEISENSGFKIKRDGATGKDKEKEEETVQKEGGTRKSVHMTLIFDLVDAYMDYKNKAQSAPQAIKTVLSAIDQGGFQAGVEEGVRLYQDPTKGADISLYNRALTCYKRLQEASEKQYRVLFEWGSLKYHGFVTSFNSKMTYFSNQGEPLRAEVSLSMEVVDLADYKDQLEEEKKQKEAKEKAEAEQVAARDMDELMT